ncbi:MAG: SufD family Fe-S cluster assembly protein, partial [Candidatus Andersenbacteria bacterium]|nr:SufD family Fe-S cluster assembly protein [Candidatus Andersenbacteria bacterium]
MPVQTNAGLAELQQKAAGLLESFYIPSQRYGTAFHLTPPFQDVREIGLAPPVRQMAEGRRGGVVYAKMQPPLSPLSGGDQKKILNTLDGRDPYLLWLVAHLDTIPVRIVRVEQGQTMQLNVNGSELMWVFLQKDARLTIEHAIIQPPLSPLSGGKTLALPRIFVWQEAGSEFTYWGLRANNTFLSERLQVRLLGEGAAVHVRHLTYGGKPVQKPMVHPGGVPGTLHLPGSTIGHLARSNAGMPGSTIRQQSDIEVSAFHEARQTVSDLAVRSAAADRHVAIYRGLIDIAENAGGSKGYQSGRALLLSRTAVVDNLPELAINTNDVQCSHGVTTTHI